VIGILEFKTFLASTGNSTGKITSAITDMGKASASGGRERPLVIVPSLLLRLERDDKARAGVTPCSRSRWLVELVYNALIGPHVRRQYHMY
jgi:hypothetical protein